MYEYGARVYSSEEILKILFNPKSKVCTSHPTCVKQSTTFVVNLDYLEHPEDIRKDDYGKWNYSGSHVHHFSVEKTSNDDLQIDRVLQEANPL